VEPGFSPQQVAERLREEGVQLVDVRSQEERDAGRIAGDRHIEFVELTQAADTISREQPVVFYCRSGSRSAMAATAFREAGYDAYNMTGGLLDWQAAGLPLEPEDGHVA
jgi:rhodanese-related sulfurtransferase